MKRIILSILMFLSCAAMAAKAQSTADIKFDDKSEIRVLDFYRDDRASNIQGIAIKFFTAEFYTIRKTNKVFDDKTLRLLREKKPSLARQIRKIKTTYEIRQGDETFGFAAFNSVNYDNFRNCTNTPLPCKIRCEAVIITLEDNGEKKSILVIKSIQKLK
jgi:hypothetical protein